MVWIFLDGWRDIHLLKTQVSIPAINSVFPHFIETCPRMPICYNCLWLSPVKVMWHHAIVATASIIIVRGRSGFNCASNLTQSECTDNVMHWQRWYALDLVSTWGNTNNSVAQDKSGFRAHSVPFWNLWRLASLIVCLEWAIIFPFGIREDLTSQSCNVEIFRKDTKYIN